MAGAKPGVHVLQLKPITVPDSLQNGHKFIKWDDDSSIGVPVTLRVDPKGYILYWKDQQKDLDCLDMSIIRDVRTGQFARTPKDQKLRETCIMGSPDIALEDKTISLCYGTSIVNVTWISFVAISKEIAKEWMDQLTTYINNLLAVNGSVMSFLEKMHTKISYVFSQDGKIPVKNILKVFAQHKDDRKKVEKALEAAHLPSGRNDTINSSKFTFAVFLSFYRHLTGRTEVEKIFHELGSKKKPYITAEQFVEFLNSEQRDPRLNEILYPYYDVKRAQAIIDICERNHNMASKDTEDAEGHLSQEGFLWYLLSEENNLNAPEKYDLCEDMTQSLSHYFINSSHNTYLTGHQLTGRSSVEMYRQVLLTGCRCIELDCWDGKGSDEEPVITHGHTMCTEILFREVIEAIAECAFKVSEYPIILSFENHCTPRQQAKMAEHCKNIFGDLLLKDPIESHQLEADVELPSPESIKRKIVIKNKKRHLHKAKEHPKLESKPSIKSDTPSTTGSESTVPSTDQTDKENSLLPPEGVTSSSPEKVAEPQDDDSDSDSDLESDDDDIAGLTEEEEKQRLKEKRERGTAGQEAEAGMEMSALVNYIQPVRFHTFEYAEKRNRSYECSSFVETQATTLLKEQPVEFVNYNKRQLSRIYPRGTRVDSSNYMPQVYWNAGCQLVALNFQTLDFSMQLNLGLFEYNGRSGYILKPDFMRRKDRHFDPFAESTVDGIVAGTVSIKVISGQFLTDRKVGTYAEVEMYGLPADTVRRRFRTKTVPINGINPVWDQDPFVFKKVVLPNLAVLRICVSDETGRFLGHRIIRLEALRPGYRHISLRNELNQPLSLATVFVHISVKDYVPDALADLAAALADPIAYQSALEKHEKQLEIMTKDFEVEDETLQEETKTTAGPVDFSRKTRTGSIMSKKSVASSGSDDSKVQPLSRVGSLHGHQLAKQESSSSMAVSAAGPENGTGAVSFSTKLNDPELVTAVSLDELRKSKQYQKVLAKQDKDIETLRRKNEKTRSNLQELHDLQEEKLILAQVKEKTALEKLHAKASKRASKKGNGSSVEMSQKQEVDNLLASHEQKHKELKANQREEMTELCKNHYKLEMDMYLKYHPQLCNMLTAAMETSQLAQAKQLEELHDLEVKELKKRLDIQNKEENKSFAKMQIKDKNELSRLKREAQQKHINMAVQERQMLRDLVDKKLEELKENQKLIAEQLAEEFDKIKNDLQAQYEEKCSKVEEEFVSLPQVVPQSSDQAPGGTPAESKETACENGEMEETTKPTENGTKTADQANPTEELTGSEEQEKPTENDTGTDLAKPTENGTGSEISEENEAKEGE